MGVNARIRATSHNQAHVDPPGGTATPPVQAVCLVDGSGNIIEVEDNGDGTGVLHVSVDEIIEPSASTVAVALTGADQVISATPLDYRGFTIYETAGAVATVLIKDGTTILDAITLKADGCDRAFYGDGGIETATGIAVDVVAGTVAGSVRTGS